MRFISLFLLSVVSFSSSAGFRELQTGNDLLCNIKQGKNGDSVALIYTNGYLRGVTDSLFLIGSLCPPDGVDMSQYTDIVEKYLNKNPESRNESAVILTAMSIGKTFPCKKSSGNN